MTQAIEFIIGLAITILMGLAVRPFLKKAVTQPIYPDGLKEEDWQKIIERSPGGVWIGLFERIISLVSFWTAQYTIIAAWLAFKVAAKWEAWKNIVQVPDNLDGVHPLKWYQARNALGSWMLARFLIGTSINILLGALGAYAGLHSMDLIKAILLK